jgi:hypothetical protein
MKKTGWLAVALGALLGLGLLGCGGDGTSNTCTGCIDKGAWSYPEHQYVTSKLVLPLDQATLTENAFDLDKNGTVDNQLGNILIALKDQMGEVSPQGTVDGAIADGTIVLLLSVYAKDIQASDQSIIWAFLGESATGAPVPGKSYTVNTDAPSNAYFGGKIKAGLGTYGGDDATLTLSIALTETPLELSLREAHVEFDVSADGKTLENGRLGGAIPEADINTQLLPEMQKLMQDQVTFRCGAETTPGACACTPSNSGGATIQQMFDTNDDCTITIDEIKNNDTLKLLLKGDITLKDGTKAMSLGLGFEAIDAAYTHIAPPQ